MSVKNYTAYSDLILVMGQASIHLENLSTATSMWVKPPSSFCNDPKRSSPHTAKGHVMGMVYKA